MAGSRRTHNGGGSDDDLINCCQDQQSTTVFKFVLCSVYSCPITVVRECLAGLDSRPKSNSSALTEVRERISTAAKVAQPAASKEKRTNTCARFLICNLSSCECALYDQGCIRATFSPCFYLPLRIIILCACVCMCGSATVYM